MNIQSLDGGWDSARRESSINAWPSEIGNKIQNSFNEFIVRKKNDRMRYSWVIVHREDILLKFRTFKRSNDFASVTRQTAWRNMRSPCSEISKGQLPCQNMHKRIHLCLEFKCVPTSRHDISQIRLSRCQTRSLFCRVSGWSGHPIVEYTSRASQANTGRGQSAISLRGLRISIIAAVVQWTFQNSPEDWVNLHREKFR
jgi:hypothetical protein